MKKKQSTPRVGAAHPENRLQQARINAGISQETAAGALGCEPRTVQR